MLGLPERGHAAIFEDTTGPGVIGGEREDDVAVEGVELGREVARAAMHLEIGAREVFRVDAEIAGRARHDLGETIGANGGPGIDGEAAFLPDQGLQERAPLDGGEACAGHTGKATGLLGHADDELFDVFRGVAEHLRAARVGVDLARAIDRLDGAVGITAAALQPRDHGGQALTPEAGLGVEDALQGGELLPFDLGNELAHGKLVRLQGQIGFAVARLDDVARGQPAVIGRHALGGNETRQQTKREEMGEPRRQWRPPPPQAARRCNPGLSRPSGPSRRGRKSSWPAVRDTAHRRLAGRGRQGTREYGS